MPNLAGFLARHDGRQRPSLALAALAGGVFALVVGLAADAALRARRRHRDVRRARDHAQRPPLLREDRPGTEHVLVGARDDGPLAGDVGALVAIGVAFAYQRSRFGRMLRATREDSAAASAVGVSVYRQRLGAFVALRRPCRLRGRPLRASAARQLRVGLSRSHVHHARDARRRRRDEPLGRGRRRARDQRARLVPRQGGERRRRSSAARSTCPQARGSSSSARSWPSCSSSDRAGSPAAASSRRMAAPLNRICVAGAGTIGSLLAAPPRARRGRLGADPRARSTRAR